jgi:DNA excision repair protein ERCC-2
MVPEEEEKECVVVFDEAHNIDDQCAEAYKIELNRPLLDTASRNADFLKRKLEQMKEVDKHKLEDEYNRLLKGMTDKGIITEEMKINETANAMIKGRSFTNRFSPLDLAKDAIPPILKKADSFVDCLKRFVGFMKSLIMIKEVKILSPSTFLEETSKIIHLEPYVLK